MITNQDWLPVGTVVKLQDGERPVMISGFMAMDSNTGRLWDYMGYPFPEGYQTGEDFFFDKQMIVEIYQIGLLNSTGCAFQAYLEDRTLEFEHDKEKRSH